MSATITTTRTVTTTLDLDDVTLANGVTLIDAGTITQDGTVQFGATGADSTALTIGPGAVFALLTDAAIGVDGAATITNAGLFAKTGIAQYQVSDIDPVFEDAASGIVEAAIGDIDLQGGGTIAGTLAGAGAIDLGDEAGSTTTYVIAAGAVIAVATLAVEGDGFSGVSDLSLGPPGSTRTFANALQLGEDSALLGGTMVIAGTATINNFILSDGAAIVDTGTIIENLGGLQLGSGGTDSGSLTIAAGGVFDAVDDQGYGLSAGGDSHASIVNDGLLEATSPVDDDVVSVRLTNAATGTIAVIDGGLAFTDNGGLGLSRTLTNDGLVTVANGDVSLIAVTASDEDTGTIDLGAGATASITGAVAASQRIDFTGTADLLALADLAGFAGTIAGFAAGDTIDLVGQTVTGASFDAADGVLTLNEGATPQALTLAGFAAADLALLNDGAGGTWLEILPGGGTFVPATQVADAWSAGSGDWGNAANWHAGEPGPTSLVTLDSGAGVIDFTTIATIAALADGDGASLALDQTGGTLTVLDGGNFTGPFDLAAGVLADDGNVLQLAGATTIAGTLAGAGVIDLAGNALLGPADLAVAALEIGGTLTLMADASYSGDLQALAGAIDLNGYTLTLAGAGTLTGGDIDGPGTLSITGRYALGDDVNGNAVLIDAGTITEGLPASDNVAFDDGTTALTIAPGGVYDDADGGFAGTIVNDGMLAVSNADSNDDSNDDFLIYGTLFNDGTVSLAAGTGLTADFSTVTGTFEGAGTLSIGDDADQSYAIAPAANLGAAALDAAQGGTFDLDGNAYTSALNIQLDYLAIGGPGTLDLTGNTALDGLNLGPVVEDGAVLVDAGTMLLDGALGLSGESQPLDPSRLSIAADATFAIVGPDGMSGGGIIENAGLFAQSFGDQVETIGVYLANTGILDVLFGTLDFVDGASLGGTVEGGGLIELGGGVFTIAPAAAITADVAVSGTTALSLSAGTDIFAGGLALGIPAPGPLRYATLEGAGTLSVGAGTLGFVSLTGGAALLDTGLVTLEDSLQLGNAATDSASIAIAGGATFALAAGAAIGADGTAAIDNEGTILADTADIDTDIVNGGVFIAGNGATVTLAGAITGTGLIIDDPSTLILSGPVAAGQTVGFAGGGIVALGDVAAFAGTIAGFGSATTLDLTGLAPGAITGHRFAGGVLTLDSDGGDLTITFANPATLTGAFSIASDGAAGSDVEQIPCFAAGTRIMTVTGEKPVEAIEVGDIVITVRPGGPATRRVVWVGSRTLRLATTAQAEAACPIRITAGAFANGVPERDLRLSPRHAVMIGGTLFEAQSLVNGATIFQERACPAVTYHHVELDGHDILLAEGLPAESFLDTGNRHMFGDEALDLRDEDAPSDAGCCLKLVREGAALTAARAGLLARAACAGFITTETVSLELRAEGRRLRPIGLPGGALYRLPAGARSVALISPAAGASDTAAEWRDRRRLGVALNRVRLIAGVRVTDLDLTSPAHAGLYPPADGAVWTNGAAILALPHQAGSGLLSIGVVAAVPRFVREATAPIDAGWRGLPGMTGDLLPAWE